METATKTTTLITCATDSPGWALDHLDKDKIVPNPDGDDYAIDNYAGPRSDEVRLWVYTTAEHALSDAALTAGWRRVGADLRDDYECGMGW